MDAPILDQLFAHGFTENLPMNWSPKAGDLMPGTLRR